jgi:hypothetical protein
VTFTFWLLGILGTIILGGLIFARLHPDFQGGSEGMPNKSKTHEQQTTWGQDSPGTSTGSTGEMASSSQSS